MQNQMSMMRRENISRWIAIDSHPANSRCLDNFLATTEGLSRKEDRNVRHASVVTYLDETWWAQVGNYTEVRCGASKVIAGRGGFLSNVQGSPEQYQLP